MAELRNKVVVVTGASSGIGAATALLAAAEGYAVAINYMSDHKAAEALVDGVAQLVEAGAVGDVEGNQGRRLAGSGADGVVQFLEAALGARDGHHMSARDGEGLGAGAADAAAGAGNQSDTILHGVPEPSMIIKVSPWPTTTSASLSVRWKNMAS